MPIVLKVVFERACMISGEDHFQMFHSHLALAVHREDPWGREGRPDGGVLWAVSRRFLQPSYKYHAGKFLLAAHVEETANLQKMCAPFALCPRLPSTPPLTPTKRLRKCSP